MPLTTRVDADNPVAVCDYCGHEVECITVSDGTTYMPTGWVYHEDEIRCGNCWRSLIVKAGDDG